MRVIPFISGNHDFKGEPSSYAALNPKNWITPPRPKSKVGLSIAHSDEDTCLAHIQVACIIAWWRDDFKLLAHCSSTGSKPFNAIWRILSSSLNRHPKAQSNSCRMLLFAQSLAPLSWEPFATAFEEKWASKFSRPCLMRSRLACRGRACKSSSQPSSGSCRQAQDWTPNYYCFVTLIGLHTIGGIILQEKGRSTGWPSFTLQVWLWVLLIGAQDFIRASEAGRRATFRSWRLLGNRRDCRGPCRAMGRFWLLGTRAVAHLLRIM